MWLCFAPCSDNYMLQLHYLAGDYNAHKLEPPETKQAQETLLTIHGVRSSADKNISQYCITLGNICFYQLLLAVLIYLARGLHYKTQQFKALLPFTG